MDKIWTRAEFEEKLREKGRGYHIYHPFHVMMYEGKLTKEQLQSWVLNRFYYQIGIPQKDAAILSNCPDVEVRKQWIVRITDHDGVDDAVGGIEAWIKLGEAVGLTREDVTSLKHVSPGVRFAVDAYINFAKQSPWQESVCS
jgi:pyrroloquinoline-quinone synthase